MNSRELRSLEEVDEGLRFDAYYYGFTPTGSKFINRILSAVACAGKAYHNTVDWNDETHPYEKVFRGSTPIEWIQNAADDAADFLQAQREAQAAPPPTPKGLERWREILAEEMASDKHASSKESELQNSIVNAALSAIRRSVEEALVAAHAPKGAPLGGEE